MPMRYAITTPQSPIPNEKFSRKPGAAAFRHQQSPLEECAAPTETDDFETSDAHAIQCKITINTTELQDLREKL